MSFKVGDKARVTRDLIGMDNCEIKYFDLTSDMIECAGKVFTIDNVFYDILRKVDFVTFEGDKHKYLWNTELLDLVENESSKDELAKTKNRMKCIEEDNAILKEKLREAKDTNEMLMDYYNRVLDKLVSTGDRMARLEKDNMELRKKCSVLEGKLNRARSIIGMLTGREF